MSHEKEMNISNLISAYLKQQIKSNADILGIAFYLYTVFAKQPQRYIKLDLKRLDFPNKWNYTVL